MATSLFQPHGKFSVSLHGQIIEVSAQGPWNAASAKLYRAAIDDALTQLYHKPWGLLTTLNNEAIILPEVHNALRQGALADIPRGRIATAFFLNNMALEQLAREQIHEIYSGLDHPVAIFSEAQPARLWLHALLASHQQ